MSARRRCARPWRPPSCGWRPGLPLIDPMCGSGTLVIEAAEAAAGLDPGRARGFAFERMAGFDPAAFEALRTPPADPPPAPVFFGFDRDAGAVGRSRANAARAGVGGLARFETGAISALAPPDALSGAPPGLVMANPPYGARLGEAGALRALYGALGAALRERFAGWRVGLITSEDALARATGLPFAETGPPVPHGPLRVRLHRAGPL